MNNRRIFAQSDEIIEIVEPSGLSALKVQVLKGKRGNTQVFVWSQPGILTHLNSEQYSISQVLIDDLNPSEL